MKIRNYCALSVRLFTVVIFCGTSACGKGSSGAANTPPPDPGPPVHGLFKVDAGRIVDSLGVPFVAKGVNVDGSGWPWTEATLPDSDLITNVWKCNIVRVNCWPQHPPYANPANADLDGIVNTFTSRNVVVIIEDHSFTGSYPTGTDLQNCITWWTSIAKKYLNNRYVWFNLLNEPGNNGSPAPPAWYDTHDAIINAIRTVGADNIIVCDEQAYGQANGFDRDSSSAVLLYGPGLASKYTNIAFSLHLYDQWVYGQTRLQAYIDAAHSKNLAVMIGEYGVGANYSMAVATDMFKVCVPGNIGRIAWHWAGGDIHRLTTSSDGCGHSIDNISGAKPGNLSFGGNLVWLDNHGQLQANDPALIPPAVIVENPSFDAGEPFANSTNIDGWINFGTAHLDNTPANVQQGTYSIRIDQGSAGGCGQVIYLQPGATYKMTAWGKHSQTASSPSVVGLKYGSTFTAAQTTLAELDFAEDGFVQKAVTFTAPSRIGSLFLFIYKTDAMPSFWCDNIAIEKQ